MSIDFPLTDWSMLVRAGGPDSPEMRGALESMCMAYRGPIVSYIRYWGWHMASEEEDMANAFISDFIQRQSLSRVRLASGRFRDFLKGALRHFIINVRRERHAQKRGGQAEIVSFEAAGEPAGEAVEGDEWSAAGKRLDAEWARTVWQRSLARLRVAWDAERSDSPLREWEGYLAGESGGIPYLEKAESLGLTLNQVNKRVAQARERMRQCLECEIARTVAPHEVHDELRYLLTVLADFTPV